MSHCAHRVAGSSSIGRGPLAALLLVLVLLLGWTLARGQRAPAISDAAMSAPTGGRLVNLSTRGLVQGGDQVLIGGLIIRGTAPQPVLLRALGPTLADAVPGALTDPRLRLMNAQGQELARNDNWQESAGAGAIQATGLAPPDRREAALLTELAPGAYTVIVEGVNGATGIGLVEAYPLGEGASRLVNLSTRGGVENGDGLLIGGFVIGGTVPKTVLIRGLGPSLTGAVPSALDDPWLELFSGGATPTRLTRNDQWQSHAATAAAVRAANLAPPDEREAAILTTLPPGPYTALLRGVNDTTGIALMEIIEVDTSGAWLAQGSGRSEISTGDAVAIGGFTIAGPTPQQVLIRGLGPSLSGVVSGALTDPQLRLFTATGKELAANNNWQDAQAAEILASGLAPGSSAGGGVADHPAPRRVQRHSQRRGGQQRSGAAGSPRHRRHPTPADQPLAPGAGADRRTKPDQRRAHSRGHAENPGRAGARPLPGGCIAGRTGRSPTAAARRRWDRIGRE